MLEDSEVSPEDAGESALQNLKVQVLEDGELPLAEAYGPSWLFSYQPSQLF